MVDFIRMAHTSSEKMSCCFSTVVIRRAALKEKYRGGLPAFMEKYHARSNRHLVTMCEMSGTYLDRPIGDIFDNGLKEPEDFACFDAVNMNAMHSPEVIEAYGLGKPFNIDEAEWLRGQYEGNGMMVWHVGK